MHAAVYLEHSRLRDGVVQAAQCDGNVALCDGTRALRPDDIVRPGAVLRSTLKLAGGKGGYGNTLRALGRKGGITDNTGDCRDLQGRRLRDLEAASKAEGWVADQRAREEVRAREKKEREDARARAKEAAEQEIQVQLESRAKVDGGVVEASVAAGLAKSVTEADATRRRKAEQQLSARKRAKVLELSSDDESSADSDGEALPVASTSAEPP